jgi:hypothetical protein
MNGFTRCNAGVFLKQLTKPGEPSVNQHPNITFALSHHLGNITHIEIGNDAQEHRISLIWWQATHQRNRSGEVVFPVEIGAYGRIDGLIAAHGRYLAAPSPKLIDHAAVADRE